jgi:hypothetical protein
MAAGGNLAAALDAWIVFEDESGFSMCSVKIFREEVTLRHGGDMVQHAGAAERRHGQTRDATRARRLFKAPVSYL